jgi:UDPglucose--hexose-1-phosphate uridylyltransferase
MHDLRWNPLLSRNVAFAPRRVIRPHETDDSAETASPNGLSECVFCEGNESLTPPEVFAVRRFGASDGPGWISRVVPNLYPVVEGPGRYHEVVVHSPLHKTRLAELDPDEIVSVGQAWTMRLETISNDSRTRYFQAGINQGQDAGASLRHSHSQLLGVDFEPPYWKAEAESLSDPRTCPLCELVVRPSPSSKKDFIDSDDSAIALCPSWSEFPYEVLAFPRDHIATFADSPNVLEWILSLISRLDTVLEMAADAQAFNAILHTGLSGHRREGFHWHAHIYPRTAAFASIELGAGIFISTVDPSRAASELRSALESKDS